jgi:hypothetical protein
LRLWMWAARRGPGLSPDEWALRVPRRFVLATANVGQAPRYPVRRVLSDYRYRGITLSGEAGRTTQHGDDPSIGAVMPTRNAAPGSATGDGLRRPARLPRASSGRVASLDVRQRGPL